MKKILGIETSCDNTAIAILKNGKIIEKRFNFNQEHLIKEYGGYIPHHLSFGHTKNIKHILNCLKPCEIKDIDYIAVSTGPGIVLSLAIGYKLALYFSEILNKKIFYVDHIEAHILSIRLTTDIEFPYLCAVLSGGHCLFILVKNLGDYIYLSHSNDDAPGEVFDKIARCINLKNGEEIEELANKGKLINKISSLNIKTENYLFSFSGIKSRIMRYIKEGDYDINDVCYTTQYLICNHINITISNIIKNNKNLLIVKKIAFVGGVASNKNLIEIAKKTFPDMEIFVSSSLISQDNAEMIARTCYEYKQINDKINISILCGSTVPYANFCYNKIIKK